MPKAEIIAHVSFTELPQFHRLVQFVDDVERYADESDDYELTEMVRELRDDLLEDLG